MRHFSLVKHSKASVVANSPEVQLSRGSNPYAPTITGADEEPAARRIRILPVASPGGPSGCSYFTFDEFAAAFTDNLMNSCKPFGIDARVDDQSAGEQTADSTIRCYVQQVTQYRITFWQKVIKWLPLPIGYSYFAASFTVSGTIESRHHPAIPFCLRRRFKEGRLGEKANMAIGMNSEAMRIVSMAAKAWDDADPTLRRRPFWAFVVVVPAVTATLAAAGVFMGWEHICNVLPTIGDSAVRATSNSNIEAGIHAVLVSALVAPLVLAFAPRWVYADRRAGFAYRFTSTSRSVILRAFFVVGALPFAILLGLSLLPESF